MMNIEPILRNSDKYGLEILLYKFEEEKPPRWHVRVDSEDNRDFTSRGENVYKWEDIFPSIVRQANIAVEKIIELDLEKEETKKDQVLEEVKEEIGELFSTLTLPKVSILKTHLLKEATGFINSSNKGDNNAT